MDDRPPQDSGTLNPTILSRDLKIFLTMGEELRHKGESLHRDRLRGAVWMVINAFSDWLRREIPPRRYFWSQNYVTYLHEHSKDCIAKLKADPTAAWQGPKSVAEHVVPTGIFIDELAPREPCKPLPGKAYREKFIDKMFFDWITICRVTENENKVLNRTPKNKLVAPHKQGVERLKHCMPEDWDDVVHMKETEKSRLTDEERIEMWDAKCRDPWVRYRVVKEYWDAHEVAITKKLLDSLKMKDETTFRQSLIIERQNIQPDLQKWLQQLKMERKQAK